MAITLNDNISTHAPKPVEARSMDFQSGSAIPFANIAAALTAVIQAFRHQYLTIWALAANGDPLEYWWRTGTSDGALEPKSKESVTLDTDGFITLLSGYKYDTFVVLPTNTLSNLIIGTSNGGTDIEPGAPVSAGVPYVLSYPKYVTTNTPLYFGGLAAGTKIIAYKK